MSNIVTAGYVMGYGDVLVSANGHYHFAFQPDGNVVLYRMPDHTALWATATVNQGGTMLAFQPDGNLVLYRNDHSVVWASASNGPVGTYQLAVQDDGNAVIYRFSPGPVHAIWATGTAEALGGGPLPPPPLPPPPYYWWIKVEYENGSFESKAYNSYSAAKDGMAYYLNQDSVSAVTEPSYSQNP